VVVRERAGRATGLQLCQEKFWSGLHLLPVPKAWSSGWVRGLKGRGGFQVDLDWRQGRVASASVVADRDGPCIVRTTHPIAQKRIGAASGTETGTCCGSTLKRGADIG
jgi:alpha-L-fucosidase 2